MIITLDFGRAFIGMCLVFVDSFDIKEKENFNKTFKFT